MDGFRLHWWPGPPLVLLFLATLLNIPDLMVHCIVPTPTVRHDQHYVGVDPNPYFESVSGAAWRKEQVPYDTLEPSDMDMEPQLSGNARWYHMFNCCGSVGRQMPSLPRPVASPYE